MIGKHLLRWLLFVAVINHILLATTASNSRGNRKAAPKFVEPSASTVVTDVGFGSMESLAMINTEDHTVINLALNKSVRLSSSSSADRNYAKRAVDGMEDTYVESALEKFEPYLVVDLGTESYIDEIIIVSPVELGDIDAFAFDQKALAFSRNTSDLSESSIWHTSAIGAGGRVTLHAHATGRFVRIQKSRVGQKLYIGELYVMGVYLNQREKAYSLCLSGHDGSEVCSSRGVCSRGRCNCGAFYYGSRCEHMRMSVWTTCTSFFVVTLGLFFDLRRFRARFIRKRKTGVTKKSDLDSLSMDYMFDDPEKRALVHKSSSFHDLDVVRSRNSTPSMLPVQRPTPDDVSFDPYKLHVLFASPLVMLTNTEVIPVASLDVEREIELLNRSLVQGGARQRVKMEVTCATIDALQSVLTLRDASVLHLSSHCQPDIIALEDNHGAAHLVSVEALSNLLTASRPSLLSSRLVVLNCCHSAGVARAFIQAGFEHVVALSEHMRVRDATAATFTRAFYLALASAHTVGDAFRLAKEAVSLCPASNPGEANAFVLLPEGTSHDEVIWPKASPVNRGNHAGLSILPFANPCQLPGPCEDFIGRSHEMWTVLQMLQRHRVVNIFGRKGSGKTALVTHLAHHVRLRRSEALFADGVFFVSIENKHASSQDDDDFSIEMTCSQIADTLASYASGATISSPTGVSKQSIVGSQSLARRPVSQTSRESALQKFAVEKPCSLIVFDGLAPSLVESQCFQDMVLGLLRTSSKLHIVTACEGRFETAAIKIFNVMCGPLSNLDTARLLIRLCHPRLVAPPVSRTESDPTTFGEEDDEFDATARALAKCLVVRSLVGHPRSIRNLAMKVNAKCGMGETFSFSDDLDI